MLKMIIVCLFAGLGAGLGTGFAGMSAAAVISPMLITFLGMPAYEAVGIALASDVLASAVSAYVYGKNKNLDVKNGLVMMATVLVFTLAGSYFASLLPNSTMGNFSVCMTFFLGIKFIVKPVMTTKEKMEEVSAAKRLIQSVVCGVLIGLICGFVGAGGGMMMLLVLTSVLGYELKTAIGTSVFIMAFTAFTGAGSHFVIGGMPDLKVLILCVGFTFVWARVAAIFANKASAVTLNRSVGVILVILGLGIMIVNFSNNGKNDEVNSKGEIGENVISETRTIEEVSIIETTTEETTKESTEITTEETTEVTTEITTEEITETTTEEETEEQTTRAAEILYNPNVNGGTGIVYNGSNGRTVTIDPGHQLYGNSEKEPIGPGATEMKAKVTGGASGVVSGLTEYQLDLNVALRLRDELISRGYTVIMVRETNEVNISNSERAAIANQANSDVFIRIHADSYDNQSASGMSALCPTASNPYCGNIYSQSRRLTDCVLDAMVANTGAKSRGVTETNTMSGINWSQVPVVIVEMGFMSNPDEDSLMATDDYQQRLAVGMANGIDNYFR